MKEIFKSELTAISNNHSLSAEMANHMIFEGCNILDYGCGTGRNMLYLMKNKEYTCTIEGCDIDNQLVYNKDKHDIIKSKGMDIMALSEVNDSYNIILCSHVLNVIESDMEKLNVLKHIHSLLKTNMSVAIIEVRTSNDIEKSKTKTPHGNGYKIKCKGYWTYQESINKDKMEELIKIVGIGKIEYYKYNKSKHILIVRKG